MMHQCSSCHGENPVGARFCMDCGARLDVVCAVCRSAVSAEQKFCAECGTALHKSLPAGAEIAAPPAAYTPPHLAQRILASRYALRGEKKQVTVLFCDIVSSSALAATLGAEGMHSLLSEFFRVALHEVHRFEGTVNQFLGDGFMAIFGAPLAHEDHAARAARAALDIRRAVSVRVGLPIPGWSALQLRMGLNSGQVVVGAIGDDLRMDYTASGDTTHLAARLQALAAPGEIICGAATVEAARGLLVTTALAPVLVKGIASPVSHALLQGIADELITTPRRRGRFVGRNDELGVLRTALARAASGAGGVLEIEGEAGVGKSRLIAECFAEPGPAVQVVRGQCVTYGRHAPHAPIVELVRGLCGTSAHDEEHRACTAIQTALGQAGGQVDLLGALLRLPQTLANVASLDPATVRARTIQPRNGS